MPRQYLSYFLRPAHATSSNPWLTEVLCKHRTKLRAAERKWCKSKDSDLVDIRTHLIHTPKEWSFEPDLAFLLDKELISSNMQPEEVSAQIVRPKSQVHPPAYLKDFVLTTVRQRQVNQPVLPYNTACTRPWRCCREHPFTLFKSIESYKSGSMGHIG